MQKMTKALGKSPRPGSQCVSVSAASRCSPHVREMIAALADSDANDERMMLLNLDGERLPSGMARAGNMRRAYFGLVPAGWACWSSR
jgi:hypothetical protein